MARGKIIGIASLGEDFRAVIMDAHHLPLQDHADMACLTAVAADYRLDAFRPLPAWLKFKPCDIHIAKLHNLGTRLFRRLHFICVAKGFLEQVRHRRLPPYDWMFSAASLDLSSLA